EVRQPVRGAKDSGKARVGIFDCDIHPKSSLEDLRPYLSNRWWDYLQTYGQRQRHGYVKGFPYPKSQPLASRRDSWPPGGRAISTSCASNTSISTASNGAS